MPAKPKIISKSVAKRIASQKGFFCQFDGGACGIGGYCKKCPHTKPKKKKKAKSL